MRLTDERRSDATALALLALVAALLFSDVLAGANDLHARDIARYYQPAKELLRDIVLGGEFPSWNRAVAAGQPMAANPEHEVFYPLTWLILLPDFATGFRLLVFAHVVIAAWAMYALLRSMRTRPAAAFPAALSFGLGGAVLSNLSLLPILFSLAWLPLTCLFARRFLIGRSPRDFALATFFFGLQVLVGEPATLLQTGILLGLFAIWRTAPLGAAALVRSLGAVGALAVAASLLGAVQLLPAIDHFSDSVRSRGLELSMVSVWSMPPVRLAEVLLPDFLGHMHVNGRTLYWAGRLYPGMAAPFYASIYSGLLIALVAIAGCIRGVRGRGLFLAVFGLSALLAVGSHTPLLAILHAGGVARSIRFPEKFLLMGLFAAIVFAARALDSLIAGDARLRKAAVLSSAVLTLATATTGIIALTPAYAGWFLETWRPQPLAAVPEMLALSRNGWFLTSARGLLLLILLRNLPRLTPRATAALLSVFVLADLSLGFPQLAPRVPAGFHRETPVAASLLPGRRDTYRLFHEASWQPRSAAAHAFMEPRPELPWILRNGLFPLAHTRYGLQSAMDSDFDLTALLPTTDFTRSAWELSTVRGDWMDAVAPMANLRYRVRYRDPRTAFAESRDDLRELRPVEVEPLEGGDRYYFASEIVPVGSREDFVLALASGKYGPRTAFVATEAFVPSAGVVRSWRESARTAVIDVETAGRAFLVMSVTPHKYWRVAIDGAEAIPIVTNVGFQGLPVPEGRHTITMRYANPLFPAGGAVSLLALAVVAAAAFRRKQGPAAPGVAG